MESLSILTWVLTAMSLVGVWYNIKKNPLCFYIWIVANVGWIYVDIKAGLMGQAALFVIYSALSVYGIYAWRKPEESKA
ncbi:MAG: nicotinamide mononucleotide transporter [Proteobacteria bacterium]|nr:nicotinamide mononucleotide transporter [Pseudomonadota bacterium]